MVVVKWSSHEEMFCRLWILKVDFRESTWRWLAVTIGSYHVPVLSALLHFLVVKKVLYGNRLLHLLVFYLRNRRMLINFFFIKKRTDFIAIIFLIFSDKQWGILISRWIHLNIVYITRNALYNWAPPAGMIRSSCDRPLCSMKSGCPS